MSGKYDDIINMPHHVSAHHPRMSAHDRAGQFSPFASLVGYGAMIEETARSTDSKPVLDEEMQAEISINLLKLSEKLADKSGEKPNVHISYFEADTKKSGGKIIEFDTTVKKIDEYAQIIVLSNDKTIRFDDILSLTT